MTFWLDQYCLQFLNLKNKFEKLRTGTFSIFITTFIPSTDMQSWEHSICQCPILLTMKEPQLSLRITFISSHYTPQDQNKDNCFSQSIQKQQTGECATTIPEQRTMNPKGQLKETDLGQQCLTKELCLSQGEGRLRFRTNSL